MTLRKDIFTYRKTKGNQIYLIKLRVCAKPHNDLWDAHKVLLIMETVLPEGVTCEQTAELTEKSKQLNFLYEITKALKIKLFT